MFFADKLGPEREQQAARAIFAFVKDKIGHRTTVSEADLRKIVAEFMSRGPDAEVATVQGIGLLRQFNYVEDVDGKTYRIKA
jgi:hypothetical protein